jgi:hypothetical protein
LVPGVLIPGDQVQHMVVVDVAVGVEVVELGVVAVTFGLVAVG